jgi:uncharacterized protein (DUF58 family)
VRSAAAIAPPAGSQGPGVTPPAVVASLDVALRRRVSGLMPGDQRASGLGPGSELAQLRPYQPGDDVRLLDPAATARTQVPHVRLHVPERTLTTWIVLDISPSMAFGTAERLKADVADGVARVIGRLSVRRGNRVALMRFGAGDALILPPHGGRGALARLGRALDEGVGADGDAGEGLSHALAHTRAMARTPGLIVVISDMTEAGGDPHSEDPPWRAPLAGLRGRHDTLVAEIRDPREAELPDVGHLWLVDPETGRQVRVDTSRRGLREKFAAEAARRRAVTTRAIRRAGARHAVLSTEGDWLRPLGGALR